MFFLFSTMTSSLAVFSLLMAFSTVPSRLVLAQDDATSPLPVEESTFYVRVHHIGRTPSAIPSSELAVLEGYMLQAYNCDPSRYLTSASIDISSAEDFESYIAWTVELKGFPNQDDKSRKCNEEGFFEDPKGKKQRNLLDPDERGPGHQRKRRKDRPATPRGFPSTSRKRRLKGDKGCDCDEFEDFREQYTDIVADGVRNGSLNSILEVLDMFIVDPFPCPNAEVFTSYIMVDYVVGVQELPTQEESALAEGFTNSYNAAGSQFCGGDVKTLSNSDAISSSIKLLPETRRRRRNLVEDMGPGNEGDGTTGGGVDDNQEPFDNEHNQTTVEDPDVIGDGAMGGDSSPEAEEEPEEPAPFVPFLLSIVYKTTGVCTGCASDFGIGSLFNEVFSRRLLTNEQTTLLVEKAALAWIPRQLQDEICYCEPDASPGSPGSDDVISVYNELLQDETMFPNVLSVDAIRDVCVDGVGNLDPDGCTVPVNADFSPPSVEVDQQGGPLDADVFMDECATIDESEIMNSRFYDITVSEGYFLTMSTCEQTSIPKFIRVYEGSAAPENCIGISKQGGCGTHLGSRIAIPGVAGTKYIIEVFETKGLCYTSGDVSTEKLVGDAMAPGTEGYIVRPISSGGCPSDVSSSTDGTIYRFVAAASKTTACVFDTGAFYQSDNFPRYDSYVVFGGSCHNPVCIGAGQCDGIQSVYFDTTPGNPYWIVYSFGDPL